MAGFSVLLGYRGDFAMAEKGEGVGNADFAGTSRQKCQKRMQSDTVDVVVIVTLNSGTISVKDILHYYNYFKLIRSTVRGRVT